MLLLHTHIRKKKKQQQLDLVIIRIWIFHVHFNLLTIKNNQISAHILCNAMVCFMEF